MEKLSIVSFLKTGHAYHLYTYEGVEGVPDDAVVKDANEILPATSVFKYTGRDSYAGFADLFRYKLLLEKGGIWCDTDVVALKPFSISKNYVSSERKRNGKGVLANPAVMHFSKGDPLMEYCFDYSSKIPSSEISWGQIGPKLLDRAIRDRGLNYLMKSPKAFCPVNWWDYNKLVDGSLGFDFIAESKAIHLWNEMWRKYEINKNEGGNAGSLYGKLIERFL